MSRIHLLIVAMTYVVVTLACASTPPPAPEEPAEPPAPTVVETPSWIDSPSIEGGFAATECVRNIPGQRSILIKKATTLARAEIANQVDVQVKEMTKVYREMVELKEGDAISESLEQVLKTVTDQQLMGARPVKSGYHDFGEGIQYLCVMVALDPAQLEAFYDALVGESGMEDRISPQQKDVLFHQFKASEAQEDLKEETGG